MIAVLQGLAARAPLQCRVAVVVAHPDDETIAAGASLHLMPGLVLVHVTDGAPRRLDDARDQGFDTPEAYAVAREAELQAALATSGVAPERVRLGVPDQDAALHMRGIAGELGAVLARYGVGAVLTHAYEGGHPDHDATALAVQLAAGRLGVPVFEFAGYHAGAAAEVSGPGDVACSPSSPGSTHGYSVRFTVLEQHTTSWPDLIRPSTRCRYRLAGTIGTLRPRVPSSGPAWITGSSPVMTWFGQSNSNRTVVGLTRGSHASGDSAGRASAPTFPLAWDPRIESVDDVLWVDPAVAPGGMVVQRFLPGPAETLVRLDRSEVARKQAMLDCFRTQSGILRLFSAAEERFRPAPGYDFHAPPHAGPLNYETWGWEMTGARWRSLAAAAMEGPLACAG